MPRSASCIAAAAFFWAGSVGAQDPVTTGPAIYKPLLDIEGVRVLEAQFKPGAKIALHSHPDHAAYVLDGGTLRVSAADGKVDVYELKREWTVWPPAQSHSATNPGKTTVRVLVIELKEPPRK